MRSMFAVTMHRLMHKHRLPIPGRPATFRGLLALLVLWAGLSLAAPGRVTKPVRLTVTERSLGKIQPGAVWTSVMVSRDSSRVAYAIQRGARMAVAVDGDVGDFYDGIGKGTLTFSPNGKRVA